MNREIIGCSVCSRLVRFRVDVASRSNRFSGENYWSRPVPGFGEIDGRLLIVGLAPAATGANRTGRIFTGDKSSDFLVSSLHEAGITNLPSSISLDDGLRYINAFITAVLKCVPPADRPDKSELLNCAGYFDFEIESMKNLKAILVLGRIAHDSVLKHFRERLLETKNLVFKNGMHYDINGIRLYCSYHPSPRNVNTHRINREEFVHYLKEIKAFIE